MEVLMDKKIGILTLFSLALMMHANGQATPQPEAPPTQTAAPEDLSKRLDLLFATEGGGGFTSGPQPTAYAGIKFGGSLLPRPWTWTASLGYDRLRARNGFSAETSGLLPVFRMPGPRRDPSLRYLRVYTGPGIGARTGNGGFGPYLSAHVMVGLFSNKHLDLDNFLPYVEYERRFPFNSLGQGDNRVKFGLMIAAGD